MAIDKKVRRCTAGSDALHDECAAHFRAWPGSLRWFAVQNKGGKKELVMLTGIGSVKSEPNYTTMIPDERLHIVSVPCLPA